MKSSFLELLSVQFQLSALCIISNNFHYNLINIFLSVKKSRLPYAFTLKAKTGSLVNIWQTSQQSYCCLDILSIIIFEEACSKVKMLSQMLY